MSDLTDNEWNAIKHLFEDTQRPRKSTGRPSANARAVLDAIRWIQTTGERWLYLPSHYPPQQTCYSKYLIWKKDGRLNQAMRVLDGAIASGDALTAAGPSFGAHESESGRSPEVDAPGSGAYAA
ncbi:transposase [Pararobbsia silviterrae]|uniref:Transposase n=1 Tax=Pararobbsia silviterrae TaxID=1792498 RepID=A0A494Y1G0_9BURK|nr:transposase [Pararobbsia silviterrae]RKP56604.1 transposase [Pararobbsia silviterrae]